MMIEQLLTSLNSIKIDNDKDQYEQYEEHICKAVADFCLRHGRKAWQFQNQFLTQMISQAKKHNPDYSNVRLSVATGVDRRNIKRLLNGEKLYNYHPKEDIVLKYLYSYCIKYNTNKVKKKGECETFQYYCHIAANGALTHTVIAQELLAQGKIIDDGRFYQIVGLD